MAWAEKMASGRYRGVYRDQFRKRRSVSNGGRGYDRKRDAKYAAAEAETKVRRQAPGARVIAADITWGEWWDRIAPERDNPETETFMTDARCAKLHIRPYWGDTPLNKIGRNEVQKWVLSKDGLKPRKGMAESTANRIYALFSATIRAAVREEVLAADPCTHITLPRVPKKPQPFLSEEQISNANLREDYRDVVDFFLETGLRPGELCGLHADHILPSGWLLVEHVYVQKKKLIRSWPKDKDTRQVPLTPKALEVLDRRLSDRELRAGCGVPHIDHQESVCSSDLVFVNPKTGGPYSPSTIQRYLSRQGISGGSYAGRRGWVTRASSGGARPFDIAEIAGHSDISITQGYNQQDPQLRDRFLAAMGQGEGLHVVGQEPRSSGTLKGTPNPTDPHKPLKKGDPDSPVTSEDTP